MSDTKNFNEFINKVHREVDRFANDYRKKNSGGPAHYPMDLPAESETLWYHLLLNFIDTGKL